MNQDQKSDKKETGADVIQKLYDAVQGEKSEWLHVWEPTTTLQAEPEKN